MNQFFTMQGPWKDGEGGNIDNCEGSNNNSTLKAGKSSKIKNNKAALQREIDLLKSKIVLLKSKIDLLKCSAMQNMQCFYTSGLREAF